RLVTALLSALNQMGWILFVDPNFETKSYATINTLLFRRQESPPPACDWCSIVFPEKNNLYFVDVSGELHEVVGKRLEPQWIRRQYELWLGYERTKFRGSPFKAEGDEAERLKMILRALTEVLEEEGLIVYASVHQMTTRLNSGSESKLGYVWHCCR
ncbi:hypothetical protein T440DRAFT_358622, partial [Plenodomus tracheiphilus IPT5]